MMFDISDQLYCYISCFFVTQDNVSVFFVLSLLFLIKVNLNHDYNIEEFLWRKMRHITAHWVFTADEKKVLKSVLHMNNLTITEHFIEPVNLIVNIEEYIMHINSLQYDNKYNNVYNILPSEYHKFANIFKAAEKQSLSEKNSHDHAIGLKLSQQLSFKKLYSMFSVKLNVLKAYLNDIIKADIICKLISSAASPVMFILKSDSSLQLIIDYKYLNNIIIKNCYSLLLISDMLNCLQSTQKFTKLNCKNAYNWIQIRGEDKWKTVFWTQFKLFKYLIIFFSLINASVTF